MAEHIGNGEMEYSIDRWWTFGEAFEVLPDRTTWDLKYHKIWHENRKNPQKKRSTYTSTRKQLEHPKRGMKLLGVTPDLHKLHGIYLIAHKATIMYVGRAGGSETIGSRISKHRIKLTGSNSAGIHHPSSWQRFTEDRYRAAPELICNDTLDDFSFAYIAVADESDTNEHLDDLEHAAFWAASDIQGSPPILNKPSAIRRRTTRSLSVIIRCPEDSNHQPIRGQMGVEYDPLAKVK